MNETDVREIVVRPLLHRLGYKHGSENNIRTEVTLKYDKHFLGHKSKKDPEITGRADYLCEVVGFGRWAVEVKSPQSQLEINSVNQAHTYAAHPEVSARFFMLTNGRKFLVFQTSRLETPILEWNFDEIEDKFINIYNLLGPPRIKVLTKPPVFDGSKPLGIGLPSEVAIANSDIDYKSHIASHPLFDQGSLAGTKGVITDGFVFRNELGQIAVEVGIRSPIPGFDNYMSEMGLDRYTFLSSSEYISNNVDVPTFFQNFVATRIRRGTHLPGIWPSKDAIVAPFDIVCDVTTDVTGYVENDTFLGVAELRYTYRIENADDMVLAALAAAYGEVPTTATLEQLAIVKLNLKF
jgi:Type I restriction enzyme R protein N terminus (HSDR_N)